MSRFVSSDDTDETWVAPLKSRKVRPGNYFALDDEKNAKLKAERGIGFEEIVFHIERGTCSTSWRISNPERYAGQRIFGVRATTMST
jgi:hypothetical protein